LAEPPGTVRSKRTRIHQGLVGRRDLVGSRYLADSELRQEYAAEIAPRTRAALARIFERVELRAPRRVLDLGAGTGAAGEAVRARWGEAVELVAVDRVGGPGMVVADVTRSGRPPGVEGRFDLITAAHLLNELDLDVDGRASLVAGWCVELLAPAGSCIVVEPALRETSRCAIACSRVVCRSSLRAWARAPARPWPTRATGATVLPRPSCPGARAWISAISC
jgi:hypothetical protein